MCTFCQGGPETIMGISAAGMLVTRAKLYLTRRRGDDVDDGFPDEERDLDQTIATEPAAR